MREPMAAVAGARLDRRMSLAMAPVLACGTISPPTGAGSRGRGAMPALELWSGRGMDRVVTLGEVSLTIGSDPESADLALDDPAVSRVHAILEPVGIDLAGAGPRIAERHPPQRQAADRPAPPPGPRRDPHRAAPGSSSATAPMPADRPPTRSSRRPRTSPGWSARCSSSSAARSLSHNLFQPPASVREIADRLFIGKNAVQAHLTQPLRQVRHLRRGRRRRATRGPGQRGDATRGRHHRRPRRSSSRRRRRAWLTTSSSARGTRCCER